MKCPKCFHDMTHYTKIYRGEMLPYEWVCLDCGEAV